MSSGGAACKDRQGELANYGVCYKCKAKSKKALEGALELTELLPKGSTAVPNGGSL